MASWTFGRPSLSLPDLRKVLPDLREDLRTTPGPLAGTPNFFQISEMASWTFERSSCPLSDLQESLPTFLTPSGPPEGTPDLSWTFKRAYQPIMELLEGPSTPT